MYFQKEGACPASLAIDRPSDKMLGFYKRKFNLSAPIKQVYAFNIYPAPWDWFAWFKCTNQMLVSLQWL